MSHITETDLTSLTETDLFVSLSNIDQSECRTGEFIPQTLRLLAR